MGKCCCCRLEKAIFPGLIRYIPRQWEFFYKKNTLCLTDEASMMTIDYCPFCGAKLKGGARKTNVKK